MDGMTDEEMEFCLKLADAGFDPEDVFERLDERVPLEIIEQVFDDYDDDLMQKCYIQEFY